MKTLYLHIGTIKTGTKAIQCFCWENLAVLQKYGYTYPDLSALCPECTQVKNAHFLIDKIENNDKSLQEAQIQEKCKKGMEQVTALFSDYDNIILSDEGIYGATYHRRKTLWQELKEYGEQNGFSVKIILYLRRQDELMISKWNQHIKANSINPEQTFDEFISVIPKNRQLNYYKKLESISSILGKENIIVRPFVKETFWEGSIYADFLHSIGLNLTEEYQISKEKRNQSLTGNTHEIMRVLNGVPELSQKDLKFMRNILRIEKEISSAQYPSSMFSKKEFKKFIKKYVRTNQLVAKEYLSNPDGALFDYTPPAIPKWTADNPFMQQDIIRFTAIGIKKLREENKKLQLNFRKLEQKVELMLPK